MPREPRAHSLDTGISPLDPVTFISVLLLVFLTTAAAALVPSTRAAQVEPVRVLREE